LGNAAGTLVVGADGTFSPAMFCHEGADVHALQRWPLHAEEESEEWVGEAAESVVPDMEMDAQIATLLLEESDTETGTSPSSNRTLSMSADTLSATGPVAADANCESSLIASTSVLTAICLEGGGGLQRCGASSVEEEEKDIEELESAAPQHKVL
jgi:hypothetical protein